MTQRNDGRGEINSLQNHFTAYLTVAVWRCKSRYLEDLRKLAVYEPSYDFQETPLDSTEEPDLLSGLPLMDTIENKAVYRALKSMAPRDLEVLLDLIVYEMKPAELAQKLGLTYQGAMAVYYRARKKLLQQLKEDEKA